MGKFKERLRIRVMWMSFVVVSMVLGLTYLIFFLDKDKLAKGTDFITSFHSGVTFGIISLLIYYIINNLKAMNDEKLNKLRK